MGGAVVAILLVAVVLVAITDLRVEHLGPVLLYGLAAVGVVALLLAPAGKRD
jgi:hypothetical protein